MEYMLPFLCVIDIKIQLKKQTNRFHKVQCHFYLLTYVLIKMMSILFVAKYNLYYLVFCVKQIKSSVLGVMTVQCMYDDIHILVNL